MLTRLKVSGFKNLVDVDVRFGPFTCIAGVNGTGKSNLFDAIRFLSALADKPFAEAARLIRNEDGRSSDVKSLFHCVGNRYDTSMKFEAEMIVPENGVDDFGQPAKATITFLRYSVELRYREDASTQGELELMSENLVPINKGDSIAHLGFPSSRAWRDSVIVRTRSNNNSAFLSTGGDADRRTIKLHQDGGNRGRPLSIPAINLPRTVLSASNAIESPTAVLARREMQSWRLLQLEPSALRKPDEFDAPKRLDSDGAHLAATLYRLAHSSSDPERIYVRLANRLSELLEDVREVWVDRDDKREIYTLYVRHRDGTAHPARALSDGTLRFLALAVLELDTEAQGVICLEEPENGIHPKRIPAMLRLLQDIAMDLAYPVDENNPLRQIIINTHSPSIVQQVKDNDILVARLHENVSNEQRFQTVQFSSLPDEVDSDAQKVVRPNWRLALPDATPAVPKGELLDYLNLSPPDAAELSPETPDVPESRRVIDRKDVQELLQLTLPLGETA
jgi:predicted ATPase